MMGGVQNAHPHPSVFVSSNTYGTAGELYAVAFARVESAMASYDAAERDHGRGWQEEFLRWKRDMLRRGTWAHLLAKPPAPAPRPERVAPADQTSRALRLLPRRQAR